MDIVDGWPTVHTFLRTQIYYDTWNPFTVTFVTSTNDKRCEKRDITCPNVIKVAIEVANGKDSGFRSKCTNNYGH